MKTQFRLAVFVYFFATYLQLSAQGKIVESGIYEGARLGGGLNLSVSQSGAFKDYTCMSFEPIEGSNDFYIGVCLDGGVRAFEVEFNESFGLQQLFERRYNDLFLLSPQPGIPFYLSFYTGADTYTPSMSTGGGFTYADPVFGWGKFVYQDETLQLLDSALEYGGIGIVVGTQTIIDAPESPTLHFTRAEANNILVWWINSSTDLVLQQTSNLDSMNWTDVTISQTSIYPDRHSEVEIPISGSSMFYHLASP